MSTEREEHPRRIPVSVRIVQNQPAHLKHFTRFATVALITSLLTGLAAGAYYAYKTGVIASVASGSFKLSLIWPPLLVGYLTACALATVLIVAGALICRRRERPAAPSSLFPRSSSASESGVHMGELRRSPTIQ